MVAGKAHTRSVMPLPSGTVSFLFTDVEESTAIAERMRAAWPAVLGDHRQILEDAIRAAGGQQVDTRGEESLCVFRTAKAAVDAALAIQRAHARHPWPEGAAVRVRVGIHTGEPAVADAGYLGLDVHRGARICALAHGGQVLLSRTTRNLVADEHVLDLGEVALKGLTRPERIFQLVAPDLPRDFAPLREAHSASGVEGREADLAAAARAALIHPLTRLRARLGRRRAATPGLASLAWEIRRGLPGLEPPFREELAALAGDLFAAGRSAADADVYLTSRDRDALLRHRADISELAVFSPRAQSEVDATAARVLALDELRLRRTDMDAVARAVEEQLTVPVDAIALRARVRSAAAELDSAVAHAQGELGPHGARLRRTRWPGVYHDGNAYAVRRYDEVGVDRVHRFERAPDARAFHAAQRMQEERRRTVQGAPHDYGGSKRGS